MDSFKDPAMIGVVVEGAALAVVSYMTYQHHQEIAQLRAEINALKQRDAKREKQLEKTLKEVVGNTNNITITGQKVADLEKRIDSTPLPDENLDQTIESMKQNILHLFSSNDIDPIVDMEGESEPAPVARSSRRSSQVSQAGQKATHPAKKTLAVAATRHQPKPTKKVTTRRPTIPDDEDDPEAALLSEIGVE